MPASKKTPARDKSDPKDAVLIGRLVAGLRCYLPERTDQVWARLRQLGARRAQLTTATGACRQQLRDLLECAWPAVLQAAAEPLDSRTWHAAVQVALDRTTDTGELATLGRLGEARFARAVTRELARWGGQRRGSVAFAVTAWSSKAVAMRTRHPRSTQFPRSAFAGFRFPSDVIVLAVRWYLRVGLSYRDVEELLAERGVEVDHVTIYRWVLRFTPLLAEAARPCRHVVGDRWQVDETYVKAASRWRYVYRAVDQAGQVVDVFVAPRRDATAARRFFGRALGAAKFTPVEVITDQAATYPIVLDELLPAAWHRTDRYANNRVEADHGRLKAWLGPMRGFRQDRGARVVIAEHGFVQHLRRGHYKLAVEQPAARRVAVAFDELALGI